MYDGDICFTCDNETIINNTVGGNPITYQKKTNRKKIYRHKRLI